MASGWRLEAVASHCHGMIQPDRGPSHPLARNRAGWADRRRTILSSSRTCLRMDMKADISDAPERVIRKHHKQDVFYTAIFLVIGSLATAGALQWIGRSPSPDSSYKQTVRSIGSDEEMTRVDQMPPRQSLDSSWLRASSEIRLPSSASRQTVFNEQNFIPRGADNVVALRVSSDLSPRQEAPKRAQLTIVRQSRSMKERACWPYRQGSIESRNCRASIGLKHRD